MNRLLWVSSFVLFQLIRLGHTSGARMERLRILFQIHHVPEDYPWEYFTSQFSVYVRISWMFHEFYVGSTHSSMPSREYTRTRKFLQLHRGQLAYYEPALLWWHHHQNFWLFFPIVIMSCGSIVEALSKESSLMDIWQPKLNAPWVGKLLKKVRLWKDEFVPNTVAAGVFRQGRRLWKKARRRLFPTSITWHESLFEQTHSSFTLLYHLGANGLAKFHANRELRSVRFDRIQIFTLYKQTRLLSEPWRTRAYAQWRSILRFRDLPIPVSQRTIGFFHLNVPQYWSLLPEWLRNYVHTYSSHAPDLHLPGWHPRELRSRPLAGSLCNWKGWLKQWTPGFRSGCICSAWLEFVPGGDISGHVACEARFICDLPIAGANMDDQLFPSMLVYFSQVKRQFLSWRAGTSLPWGPFLDFLEQLWEVHEHGSQVHWDSAQCKIFRGRTRGFVITPVDHFPKTAFALCPQLYMELLDKTFIISSIFVIAHDDPLQFETDLRRRLLQAVHKSYHWGIQHRLPYAYILPKPSRSFLKARPIISYYQTLTSKLCFFLGVILYHLLEKVFHDGIGHDSAVVMVRKLWSAFRSQWEEDCDLVNQDLTGFFTSIPASRFEGALSILFHLYQELYGLQESTSFSVYTSKQPDRPRVFRGQWRTRANRHYKTFLAADISPLVLLLVANSFFTINNLVLRQQEGSPMGSPISPPLCSLVAMLEEYFAFRAWDISMASIRQLGVVWVDRYVDNRVALLTAGARCHPVVRALFQLDFYVPPVMLEEVPNSDVVGYSVDVNAKSCQFLLPTTLSRIRSPSSASSLRRSLQSLETRLILLARGTRPRSRIPELMHLLLDLYRQKGFTSAQLAPFVSKFQIRFGLREK